MTLYALKDELTGYQQQIMIFANDKDAERNFIALAKDKSTKIGFYKNDFSIWRIGKMEKDGTLIQEKTEPQLIIRGESIMEDEK